MTSEPQIERRPIATRELAISQRVAQWLAGIGASPNGISVVGMLFGIAAGVLFVGTRHVDSTWQVRLLWLLGAACVQLRLGANMFDGMLAIATGKSSPLGHIYNEAPDRVSDCATLIGLGYAVQGSPELGYLAALLAVLTAYVRAVVKVAGGPQDFCGPMSKSHRMFFVTVAGVFMAAAPKSLQWEWVWRGIHFGLPAATLALIAVGSLVTCARRLLRGAAALQAATP